MTQKSNDRNRRDGFRQFGLMAVILLGLLLVLFRNAFRPEMTVFSNDGPLGQISSAAADTWAARDGAWLDLNWLGSAGIAAVPTFSNALGLTFGKLWFSKLFAIYSLLFAGLGAWFCFRQLKFTPLTCLLGGIAAALNGDFLPTACWGVCAQPLAFGLNYFALGLLADTTSSKRWFRVVLAGFAVGMGVMEAFDIGAIFSLFVAAFVLFQALISNAAGPRKLVQGVSRLAIVGISAGVISIGALYTLYSTQVSNIGGMEQDADTKAGRWEEATMWSLPKREALGILIPGLFGYRMDTPEGGTYWGRIGSNSSWDRYLEGDRQGPAPDGMLRFGGGSGYAGALVVVIGLWALFQSFRGTGSVFSLTQRRMIWFWLAVFVMALLLAFGRFTQIGGFQGFYYIFYLLPKASMIRNPAKFLHVVEWAWLIIFAFGLDGISRTMMQPAVSVTKGIADQWKSWRAKASTFDRRWFTGCLIGLGALVAAWAMYAGSKNSLMDYLKIVGFADSAFARELASFSIRHVGLAILLYGIAVALTLLAVAGCFNGQRARLGGILLGVFLALDLAVYSVPWVITYNWKDRLEPTPLTELLRERPYEGRVTVFPLDRVLDIKRLPQQLMPLAQQWQTLSQTFYGLEWKQHQFPYYNIQVMDVVQEPRMGTDKMAFTVGINGASLLRSWEITNTRYLLGPAGLFPLLNQQLDAKEQRFRIKAQFNVVPKPGIVSPTRPDQLTTVLTTNGQYAVFEFLGANPRVGLYSHWLTATNDPAVTKPWLATFEEAAKRRYLPIDFYNSLAGLAPQDLAALKQLSDPNFDPAKMVIVSGKDAPAASSATADSTAGTVSFASYSPKHIVLHATNTVPSVLMLKDRYNEDWKVTVDGKPAPLFRANYIARGVMLQPGQHVVDFQFSTTMKYSTISFGAVVVGLLLIGFLAISPGSHGVVEPPVNETPAKK